MYWSTQFVAAPNQVDFVIFTALREELDAVLAKLPDHQRVPPLENSVRVYYRAEVQLEPSTGLQGKYSVILLSLLGMGRVEAANATSDVLSQWNPRYILVVGIAGGIANQKVRLGDLVIADQVVDYELQKLTSDGPEVRYSVHKVDPRLLGSAQHLKQTDWLRIITERRPHVGTSRIFFGTIATGDKVIAQSAILDRYQKSWPKLMGVEMEAGGTVSAAFQRPYPPGFFMVRGVSDLADENKNSSRVGQWRRYASDIAASYAIALLKSGPVPLGASLKLPTLEQGEEGSQPGKSAILEVRRLADNIYGQILHSKTCEQRLLQRMSMIRLEVDSNEVQHAALAFQNQVLALLNYTTNYGSLVRRSTLMSKLARSYHSLMVACDRHSDDTTISAEGISTTYETQTGPGGPYTIVRRSDSKKTTGVSSTNSPTQGISGSAHSDVPGAYDLTRETLNSLLMQAHTKDLISTEARDQILERFDALAATIWDSNDAPNESLTLLIVMITAITDAFHELNKGK